jgi:hypothetical protein
MRTVIAAVMLGVASASAWASGGNERYDTPQKKQCIKEAREKFPPEYVLGPSGSRLNKNAGPREDYFHSCIKK